MPVLNREDVAAPNQNLRQRVVHHRPHVHKLVYQSLELRRPDQLVDAFEQLAGICRLGVVVLVVIIVALVAAAVLVVIPWYTG